MKSTNYKYEARLREIDNTLQAQKLGYGTWMFTAIFEGERYRVVTHDEDYYESYKHSFDEYGDEVKYSREGIVKWFEEKCAVSL